MPSQNDNSAPSASGNRNYGPRGPSPYPQSTRTAIERPERAHAPPRRADDDGFTEAPLHATRNSTGIELLQQRTYRPSRASPAITSARPVTPPSPTYSYDGWRAEHERRLQHTYAKEHGMIPAGMEAAHITPAEVVRDMRAPDEMPPVERKRAYGKRDESWR